MRVRSCFGGWDESATDQLSAEQLKPDTKNPGKRVDAETSVRRIGRRMFVIVVAAAMDF
jgi:hypothetical protein